MNFSRDGRTDGAARWCEGGGVGVGVRDASGVTIRVCCHSNEVDTNALKQLSGEERKTTQLSVEGSYGALVAGRDWWRPRV